MTVLHGAKASDDARTAIQDSTAIAYLGEILPGASADSLGILGDQDILQVSPTDTAVELTQSTPAVPGAPAIYQEVSTYGRTFARVVPSTALEAKALVSEFGVEHLSRVYLANDGQPYGAGAGLCGQAGRRRERLGRLGGADRRRRSPPRAPRRSSSPPARRPRPPTCSMRLRPPTRRPSCLPPRRWTTPRLPPPCSRRPPARCASPRPASPPRR